jgi:hypothetical protein
MAGSIFPLTSPLEREPEAHVSILRHGVLTR